MREAPTPAPAIVVGIDGSHSALTAALWAVDEALGRHIPCGSCMPLSPASSSHLIRSALPTIWRPLKSLCGKRLPRSNHSKSR
jgi:nucleotide-binding universal stress UspA family protein